MSFFALFFDFLAHLKPSGIFFEIFSDFLRFWIDFGRFWEGFGRVVSLIFLIVIEKCDFVKNSVSSRREH